MIAKIPSVPASAIVQRKDITEDMAIHDGVSKYKHHITELGSANFREFYIFDKDAGNAIAVVAIPLTEDGVGFYKELDKSRVSTIIMPKVNNTVKFTLGIDKYVELKMKPFTEFLLSDSGGVYNQEIQRYILPFLIEEYKRCQE